MSINKNFIGPMTLVLGTLTAVFFGFQNCSEMSFENADPSLNQKAESGFIVEPLGEPANETNQGTAATDETTNSIGDSDQQQEQNPGAQTEQNNQSEDGQSGSGNSSQDSNSGAGAIQAEGDDESESSSSNTCNIEIADIMVNVLRVEALAKGSWVIIQTNIGSKSLFELAAGLAINSNVALATNQIRLILAESGNFLKGVDNQEYKLTTPSGQESGLKVNLRGRTEFEPNKSVLIKFHLDPGTQIHKAGDKCMLNPVFQAD